MVPNTPGHPNTVSVITAPVTSIGSAIPSFVIIGSHYIFKYIV